MTTPLRHWVPLPQAGRVATPQNVRLYAQAAEELGYTGVWLGDHLVLPVGYTSRYPYGSQHVASPSTPFLETFTTLAYVAGATRRVRMLTTIAVAIHRHPVLMAKVGATLDVLSSGRLEIGLGAGWLEEEITALGQDFPLRHEALRESVDALSRMWTGEQTSHDGKVWQFQDVICAPVPAQPTIPLWVGASPRTFKRIQQTTDAPVSWVAPDASLETIKAGMAALRDQGGATDETRIAVKVAIGASNTVSSHESTVFDLDDPADSLTMLRDLQDRGATDVRIDLTGVAPRMRLGTIARFSRVVADAGLFDDSVLTAG
jgi:probable F420-dependent oxidoreductase